MQHNDIDDRFQEKYRRYSVILYRIGFLHLGNHHEVEDVLQDVFMKLLYKAPRFCDEEHEKAWLIRVTTNACKDTLRGFFRKRAVSMEDLQLAYDDEHKEVLQEIMKLPSKHKTVIFLHYYEGYSVSEIAGILKISESAVKMRLKRGRDRLKLELEDEDYDYENRGVQRSYGSGEA